MGQVVEARGRSAKSSGAGSRPVGHERSGRAGRAVRAGVERGDTLCTAMRGPSPGTCEAVVRRFELSPNGEDPGHVVVGGGLDVAHDLAELERVAANESRDLGHAPVPFGGCRGGACREASQATGRARPGPPPSPRCRRSQIRGYERRYQDFTRSLVPVRVPPRVRTRGPIRALRGQLTNLAGARTGRAVTACAA